jgi:chromosome segregation ATPase
MSIAVFPSPKAPVPPEGSSLSESANQELKALRTALEQSLAELEGALENPEQCDSVERLVLNLARLAIDEASATARRAILETRLSVQTQIDAVRAEAQLALTAERTAADALRHDLEDLQAKFDAEHETGVTLRAGAEQARTSLDAERTARAALRRTFEELQATLESERASAAAHVLDLDAAKTAWETERAAVVALSGSLDQAKAAADAERTAAVALRRTIEEGQSALKEARMSLAATKTALDEERAAAIAQRQELAAGQLELKTEREAGAALRGDIERAQAALAAERAANLARDEEAQTALEIERSAAAAQRRDAEGVRAALDAERATAAALHDSQERLAAERDTYQSTAAQVTENVATLQAQLADAVNAAAAKAATQAADIDAARAQISTLERQLADTTRVDELERQLADTTRVDELERQLADTTRVDELERQLAEVAKAVSDAEARLEAAIQDRDAIALTLEGERRETRAATAEVLARVETLGVQHAKLERAWQDAETRCETLRRERDAAAEELEAAQQTLSDVREQVQTYEELQEGAALRIRELESALAGGMESSEADSEEVLIDVTQETDAVADCDADFDATDLGAIAPSLHAAVFQPTRRATRHAFHEDLPVLVDDAGALLVDLSIIGAQLLATTTLKPNRIVKLALPRDGGAIACTGRIVWARLEPDAATGALRYRAGLLFTESDQAAVEAFIAVHAAGR